MSLNERYMFFDSVGEDNRDYSSADFAQYFRKLFTNGVFRGESPLLVSADGLTMNLGVKAGAAMINGRYYELTENGNIVLSVRSADLHYYLILRLNLATDARTITLQLKEGTASTLPELQRDDSVWELAVASVFMPAEQTYISASNVVDLRSNENLCGYVRHTGDPAFYPPTELPELLWLYTLFPATLTPEQTAYVESNPSLMAMFEESRVAGNLVRWDRGEPLYTPIALRNIPNSAIIRNVEGVHNSDYIVVHRGNPSADYRGFDNKVLLWRKNAHSLRQWNTSGSNDYEKSAIRTWLNGEFLNSLPTHIRDAIAEVRIPYRPGQGESLTVNSGANGLLTKVFLLSGREVGTGAQGYLPNEGTALSYFSGIESSTANAKRVVSLPSADHWFLRSPVTFSGQVTNPWSIDSTGALSSNRGSTNLAYICPAFALSENTVFYTDGTNYYGEQGYSLPGVTAFDASGNVLGGFTQIAIGSYVGTGTYGVNSPNKLTFPFKVKLIFISVASGGLQGFGIAPSNIARISIGGTGNNATQSNIQTTTWSGNTVTWFDEANVGYQFNTSALTYHYLALG